MHVNVTIIGLDRLGTSFGLALKRYQSDPKAQHTFTVIGSDTKAYAMKSAEKMKAVDNFHRAVLKASANADLLLVNVPFGAAEDLYARLGPELKPGAVVLDTSLLKLPVIDYAARYFPKNGAGELAAYLVGITPIVNARALYSGDLEVEGARADLFDEGEVLLAPDVKTPGEAIQLAEDLIGLVGAKPHFVDPAEHDGLIAATEILPRLTGASLFFALRQSEGWMELRRMINPTLALAFQSLRAEHQQDLLTLLLQNRENVARHLEGLIGVLDQVRDALAEGDEDQIEAFAARVQSEWEKWDVKRFSGKWDEANQVETLPGPLGTVGGFLTMRRRRDEDGNSD